MPGSPTRPPKCHVALLAACSIGLAIPSHAQTPPATHRVEITGGVGVGADAPVVQICCELRTRPFYLQHEEAERELLRGVDVRVHETPRLSTLVQVNRGRAGDLTLTYPRPSATLPVSTYYTSERFVRTRSLSLGVMQSLDLAPRARVRPWLGAGVVMWRLTSDQRTTQTGLLDPTVRVVDDASASFTRVGLGVSVGVRVLPAGRLVIASDGGVRTLFSRTGEDDLGASWTLERETRPYWRVAAGVLF